MQTYGRTELVSVKFCMLLYICMQCNILYLYITLHLRVLLGAMPHSTLQEKVIGNKSRYKTCCSMRKHNLLMLSSSAPPAAALQHTIYLIHFCLQLVAK